jgi:hypothetical protein
LATFLEESVGHTSYVNDMGWKSTTVKVKDPLYKRLLLVQAQLKVDRLCCVSWENTSSTRLERRPWYIVRVSKLAERLMRF